MPVDTVMVQDKWLPTGKKRWVIKSTEGKLYGAMPGIASRINKGQAYDISYKLDNWGGKTYLVVDGVLPPTGTAPPLAAPAASSGPSTSREEDIAVLAIFKCLNNIAPEATNIARALHACRQGWRMYKSGALDRREGPDDSDEGHVARPSLKDEWGPN